MIDGITVLSQNEIMDITTWTLVITIIGIIISAISFLIFIFFNQKIIQNIFGTSCICGIILYIVGLFCMSFVESGTGKYTYKVTISDEVNFVEFNDKYEIIDQDGLIYTIKEKENNNENN